MVCRRSFGPICHGRGRIEPRDVETSHEGGDCRNAPRRAGFLHEVLAEVLEDFALAKAIRRVAKPSWSSARKCLNSAGPVVRTAFCKRLRLHSNPSTNDNPDLSHSKAESAWNASSIWMSGLELHGLGCYGRRETENSPGDLGADAYPRSGVLMTNTRCPDRLRRRPALVVRFFQEDQASAWRAPPREPAGSHSPR